MTQQCLCMALSKEKKTYGDIIEGLSGSSYTAATIKHKQTRVKMRRRFIKASLNLHVPPQGTSLSTRTCSSCSVALKSAHQQR